MPLCIGKKACARARCKQRGKSYFPGQPDLERAFKKACGSNSSLTKHEFLCSGKYIDEAAYIAQYGIDPCEGGVSVNDVLFGGTQALEQEQWENVEPILIGLGILLLAAMLILFILKRG